MGDRLMEKVVGLECLIEEQRVHILQLESNAGMTKAELSTPEKNVPRQLNFADTVNPSAPHSHNDTSGNLQRLLPLRSEERVLKHSLFQCFRALKAI